MERGRICDPRGKWLGVGGPQESNTKNHGIGSSLLSKGVQYLWCLGVNLKRWVNVLGPEGLGVEHRTDDAGIREITTHEFDLRPHKNYAKFPHTTSIYTGTPLVSGTCIGWEQPVQPCICH